MTKIDIFSGFLGAGKTTLIKKLLKEELNKEKVVLIENEFGEIGIDGGFMKEAGIEIREMNSGCICCSLVGDFGASLKEVLDKYAPERILIEPSGVGKLSDVVKAVVGIGTEADVILNSSVVVVDAMKCKMYIKNFGEFFLNQIENAATIVLSRTDKLSEQKLNECVALIREHNASAKIITTPWDQLDSNIIIEAMEGGSKSLKEELLEELEHEHHHDDDDDDECECGHHHHHDDDDDECECGHHHHDDDDDDDDECECGHDHEHHHHHADGEECHCHDHDHHHDHHHHHADEVFTSWGKETPKSYTREKLEGILKALDSGEYGMILRAKGMVPAGDGTWLYFDYVPEETNIRSGKADYTGKLCVIGSKIDEGKLEQLFA